MNNARRGLPSGPRHGSQAGDSTRVGRHLLRKLGGFFRVDAAVAEALDALCCDKVAFPPHHRIVGAGEAYDSIYLLDTGWVLRAAHLENGRRQIVNVALPGDFLCFNAALFDTANYDLTTRTPVEAYRFDVPNMMELLSTHSKLALALTWANAHEEALLAERIVTLGRRSAREKVAHIFCELLARQRIVGVADDGPLLMPLAQEELADILGMSLIHTNRTIRQLVREGLIGYRPGVVTISDGPALRRLAGFDAEYLHFTQLGYDA